MSEATQNVLEGMEARLTGVLRRQDELEARFVRVEAALALVGRSVPASDMAPWQPGPPPWQPAAVAPPWQLAAVAPPWQPDPALLGASAPLPPSIGVVPVAQPAPLIEARATPAASAAPGFESRIGLQWLNRIGVLTLLLGVAFAFKTAVDNNWIGPGARIALGVVAAAITLGLGDRQWRRQHRVFAQGLTALGLALLYLSWWAAFALYDLLPQSVAFGLMVATTIAAAALALRYAAQAIAVLALLAGYATPIALSSGGSHSLFFLAYLTLLNAAAIGLARRRVWHTLEHLTAIATAVLYAGWLASTSMFDERTLALGFAGVFYVQYAVARSSAPWVFGQVAASLLVTVLLWDAPGVRVPLLLVVALAGLVVGERRRLRAATTWTAIWFWLPSLAVSAMTEPALGRALASSAIALVGFLAWILWPRAARRTPGVFDLITLLGTPVVFFGALAIVLHDAPHAYLAGLAIAVTVLYLALARHVEKLAGPDASRVPARVAVGLALTFFTGAAPLVLDGHGIAIAWALEAAGLVWLAARHRDPKLAIAAWTVLAIAAVALGLATPLAQIDDPLPILWNLRLAAFAALVASLAVAARRLPSPAQQLVAHLGAHLLALLGLGIELDAAIAASVHADAHAAATTVAISILLAVYAAGLIALGVLRHRARDRIFGLVLLGIVILKLYGSDVWSLGRGFQVAAFLALGLLMIGVSYVYSRYRAAIGRLWRDRPTA